MAAGFIIALLIHAVGAVFAGNFMSALRHDIMPAFKHGETSVLLTLVPSVPAENTEPVQAMETVMTVPDADMHAVIEDTPAELPAETVYDADMNDKGAASAPQTDSPIRPRYPRGARMRGEEGIVQLTVNVDKAGRAVSVIVAESSGYPVLDRAAVKAAKRTRYIPGRDDGEPTAGEATFSVEFKFLN